MAQVTLTNVVKRYGDIEVVPGIDLEIEDGQFVVLVGPSGCGKSTTLRMIAGLETVTDGTVKIGERVVNEVAPQNRNIAMVFQNYALYPHKSVKENIVFGLRRQKLPAAEIDKRLAEAARMLKLEEYLERKPAALSGGQRQRVAMGRAIVRDADVFLFDEPLSNLDAKLRHDMRSEIRRIHRRVGITSVYVTHDQIEAMTLADKVVVMRAGVIEQEGRPMDIYLHPANLFTATFIGAPSMNILDGALAREGLKIGDHVIPMAPPLEPLAEKALAGAPERAVKVGIRPDFFVDAGLAAETPDMGYLRDLPVDLVEPLGFKKDITVKLGDHDLMAQLDLRTEIDEGAKIDLAIDLRRVHLFDPDSEQNIAVM